MRRWLSMLWVAAGAALLWAAPEPDPAYLDRPLQLPVSHSAVTTNAWFEPVTASSGAFLRALPAPTVPLAQAQQEVLSQPDDWRRWAQLGQVLYGAGHYERAWAAVRHMREAAVQREELLPLAANALYERCRRAATALTLLEYSP